MDGIFYVNSFTRIDHVRDASSNTIAVGESVHPHPYGMGDGYGNMEKGGPTYWFDGDGLMSSVPPNKVRHWTLSDVHEISYQKPSYPDGPRL